MNKVERNNITRDQIGRFFASYFPNWRLQQLLTIEKILKEKFTFYSNLLDDTKQWDDPSGDSTIAQEITNGLYFEAISVCIQYIEDLFALLKAGERRDYFIKNIITYDAGKIENSIKQNHDIEKICRLFWIPYFKEELSNTGIENIYRNGLELLVEMIQSIKEFYQQYHFFYKQYKHGLTVALRPYFKYTEEQIEKSKAGTMDLYLAAFDNVSLAKLKNTIGRRNDMAFMPCFTENVRAHLGELMQEDNLIRYIFPSERTSIETIKNIAYKVKDCNDIFRNNILQAVQDKPPYKMRIPSPERGKIYQFNLNELEA